MIWYFMETICMKCQNLFSGKNKKKYFKISSAENNKHYSINKHISRETWPDILYYISQMFSDQRMIRTLGKIFSRWHTEIFSYFFAENNFWHFMQIVLEMSKPFSGEK